MTTFLKFAPSKKNEGKIAFMAGKATFPDRRQETSVKLDVNYKIVSLIERERVNIATVDLNHPYSDEEVQKILKEEWHEQYALEQRELEEQQEEERQRVEHEKDAAIARRSPLLDTILEKLSLSHEYTFYDTRDTPSLITQIVYDTSSLHASIDINIADLAATSDPAATLTAQLQTMIHDHQSAMDAVNVLRDQGHPVCLRLLSFEHAYRAHANIEYTSVYTDAHAKSYSLFCHEEDRRLKTVNEIVNEILSYNPVVAHEWINEWRLWLESIFTRPVVLSWDLDNVSLDIQISKRDRVICVTYAERDDFVPRIQAIADLYRQFDNEFDEKYHLFHDVPLRIRSEKIGSAFIPALDETRFRASWQEVWTGTFHRAFVIDQDPFRSIIDPDRSCQISSKAVISPVEISLKLDKNKKELQIGQYWSSRYMTGPTLSEDEYRYDPGGQIVTESGFNIYDQISVEIRSEHFFLTPDLLTEQQN